MLPGYLTELSLKEIKERSDNLKEIQKNCRLCPNECYIDRSLGEKGVCNSTDRAMISSAGPHFGEEPPLTGWNGSGTIFFANCNLSCVYCQNYDISQLGKGEEITTQELSKVMLGLQNRGCHNINFVTPTHYTPQIVEALFYAVQDGLEIPLVYNCGGYESVETLELLDQIFDIYMPDIKYSSDGNALLYSGVNNYWTIVKNAVREMHRQKGDLKVTKRGIAVRGLLVRHLVLPEDIAGSRAVIDFVAEEISKETYINIMDQYYPRYRAAEFPKLNRPLNSREYPDIINYAKSKGLHKGF